MGKFIHFLYLINQNETQQQQRQDYKILMKFPADRKPQKIVSEGVKCSE